MTLGGPLRDEQPLGNLTIAQSFGDECRDLAFAPGQAGFGRVHRRSYFAPTHRVRL